MKVQSMAREIFNSTDIIPGSTLLVDYVAYNNDNFNTLENREATDVIYHELTYRGIFQAVEDKLLIKAKYELGLPENDSLHSSSKAISLARYLKVQYLLYFKNKQVVSDEYSAQLILVKSGEILWSNHN
jgi:PBP1b-binding outer membrane lipoprotein LpoB